MRPRPEFAAVCFNLIPGVGEYFVFPALTMGGSCEIMVFEGVPGGSMDCWEDVHSPAEHLARSLSILEEHRHHDGGNHVIFIGEVEQYEALEGEPLVFHSGFYRVATRHLEIDSA